MPTPNEIVAERFPQPGEIDPGPAGRQYPEHWRMMLKALGASDPDKLFAPNTGNIGATNVVPRPDPRRQIQNNYFPQTPTASTSDPAVAGMFLQDPPAQPPGTQLAGDVVPLPVQPGPNAGPAPSAALYGSGRLTAPGVVSIGEKNMESVLRALRARQSPTTYGK